MDWRSIGLVDWRAGGLEVYRSSGLEVCSAHPYIHNIMSYKIT